MLIALNDLSVEAKRLWENKNPVYTFAKTVLEYSNVETYYTILTVYYSLKDNTHQS